MRTALLLLVAFAFVASITFRAVAADNPAPASHKGTLYHVVSFKFKDSATPEQIKAVEDSFAALKTKIPVICSLKTGTNVSPEKLNKGFTHCWVLTFASDADRDAYLVHPDHKAFGQSLGGILGDVFVIDFWAQD